MRSCLFLCVIAVIAATAAHAAPCGPFAAGTAPGSMSISTSSYHLGVHYPCRPACQTLGDGSYTGVRLFNATMPYETWPDQARVPGKRTLMSRDIVIFSSKKRK